MDEGLLEDVEDRREVVRMLKERSWDILFSFLYPIAFMLVSMTFLCIIAMPCTVPGFMALLVLGVFTILLFTYSAYRDMKELRVNLLRLYVRQDGSLEEEALEIGWVNGLTYDSKGQNWSFLLDYLEFHTWPLWGTWLQKPVMPTNPSYQAFVTT